MATVLYKPAVPVASAQSTRRDRHDTPMQRMPNYCSTIRQPSEVSRVVRVSSALLLSTQFLVEMDRIRFWSQELAGSHN